MKGATSGALQRIRDDVRQMHAYKVQDAQGVIKLDAMENPYVLSAPLQQALGERLARLPVNRYPNAQRNLDLQNALAAYAQLTPDQSVMLGNGSDELISLIVLACAKPGAVVMAPEPGFVMYGVSARLQGLQYVGVDLNADFSLHVPAMVAAMRQHRPAVIFLANPNNPTANLWAANDMRTLIAEARSINSLVVIDEAYQPFASSTWLDEIRQHPHEHDHVVVIRTLSKFGLAGIRLGYLIGPHAWVQEFDKVRPPYNVSVLNAECALFALEHASEFAEQAAHIRRDRQQLMHHLQELAGIEVFDSEANMVLIRLARPDDVFESLKHAGVLVKNVSKMHPLLAGCLRLTVGTPNENQALLAALKAAI